MGSTISERRKHIDIGRSMNLVHWLTEPYRLPSFSHTVLYHSKQKSIEFVRLFPSIKTSLEDGANDSGVCWEGDTHSHILKIKTATNKNIENKIEENKDTEKLRNTVAREQR